MTRKGPRDVNLDSLPLFGEAALFTDVGDMRTEVQIGPLREVVRTFLGWTFEEQVRATIRVLHSGPTLFPEDIRRFAALHGIGNK